MTSGADDERTIRRIVAMILQHPIGDQEDVSADDDDDWDSLRHVEIMFALEDALAIRFSDDELQELTRLSRILDAVRRRRLKSASSDAVSPDS